MNTAEEVWRIDETAVLQDGTLQGAHGIDRSDERMKRWVDLVTGVEEES